jgi:hypothetical protein
MPILTVPRPWLSRDTFRRSHFEFGAGTSLQPLLRFSDEYSDYLFVDFELEPREVQAHLVRGLRQLSDAAALAGHASPLSLQELVVHPSLSMDEIELAHSLAETDRRLRTLLTRRELEQHTFFLNAVRWARPRQWALTLRLLRRVPHVDGSLAERPLTLRLVGGEGLITYVSMGGMERAPPSVGTIQTGLGEAHDGPVARLFAQMREEGRPIPKVWVRGQQRRPGYRPDGRHPPLSSAPPFSAVGRTFAAWRSDRLYASANDRRREVKAWIQPVAPATARAVGPHLFSPAELTAEQVREAGAACLPAHLAERLGVAALPHVHAIPRAEGELLRPIADALRSWQSTPTFRSATSAVYVPYGLEDELSVVVRWLRALEGPAVTVHLPMPLDFAAAERALR